MHLLKDIARRLDYYLDRVSIRFEYYFSRHRMAGGAILTNAARDLLQFDGIVLFMDDPLMHVGDQMYFKPLATRLAASGLPVTAIPTKSMKFFYHSMLEGGPWKRPLIISRHEVRRSMRRHFGKGVEFFFIQTICESIDRPVSQYIIDHFTEYFGLPTLARPVTHADFGTADLGGETIPDLPEDEALRILAPYVDSGKNRIREEERRRLLDRLRSDREVLGGKVVLVGTGHDKKNDTNNYGDLVDYDLRGATSVQGLAALLAKRNIQGVYTYDTAVLHFANIFRHPVRLVMKRYITRKERLQKRAAFSCLYPPAPGQIEFLEELSPAD